MPERLYGPRPEVRIIEPDVSEDWMQEFNDDFAARITIDEVAQEPELKPTHMATVSVEHWFEQPRPYEASSYFEINDQLGPNGWMQQIQGKVYQVDMADMPRGVGGTREAALAIYDASVVEPDGTLNPIAKGLTVLVRLRDVKDAEIEVVPITEEDAA